MASLRIDRPGSTPDIDSSSVRFPSNLDRGSGTFTTVLRPGSLAMGRKVEVDIADSPNFKMSTTISGGREVDTMLLGSGGSDRQRLVIPPDVDPAPSHVLRIEFARWKIGRVTLGEKSLTRA